MVEIIRGRQYKIKEKEGNVTLYFGERGYREDTEVEIRYNSDKKIESIRVGVSCSACTKARIIKAGDKSAEIIIKYDTSYRGNISKRVFIYSIEEGKQIKTTINLKGRVK